MGTPIPSYYPGSAQPTRTRTGTGVHVTRCGEAASSMGGRGLACTLSYFRLLILRGIRHIPIQHQSHRFLGRDCFYRNLRRRLSIHQPAAYLPL